MNVRSPSTARSRAVRFGGALVLGSLLTIVPLAAFAQDAAAPAAPAADAAAGPATDAPAPKPTDVVAKVGDEAITEADLGYAAQDLGQQLQSVPPQEQKAFLTSVLIDMKILANAARADKLDQSADYKGRLTYLEDRALRSTYFAQTIAKEITPATVKAAYDDYVKAFQPQDEIHAAHILVKTEDEAKAVEADLAKGTKFEDEAKAKSTDTGSAANGGDLGFFGHGQMVKEFEDAAFQLKPGEVSQPVKSQFGWHVIKLIETRKTQPAPFQQIAQQLQQQMLFKTFDDAVAKLKTSTTVDIPDATLAAQVKAEEAAQAAAPAPQPQAQ